MASPGGCHIDVEALRREHSIVQLVGAYGIELTASGRSLVGRCPFHADGGRPNLHVYPDTRSWYCFRCGAGGDVIEFVRRKENCGFVEACERLTGSGSPSPAAPTPLKGGPRERRWDRLTLEEQVVMNTALAIYQRSLWQERRALDYLRGRSIPDWVARRCGLGFADGHSLEAYLRCHPGLATALALGLLRKSERGDTATPLHELLAGRIVVPELRACQAVWFIGRDLGDAPGRPKYLAVAGERPVLGLQRVAGRRVVYLCEGVFDYLTALAWRLPAFSPCGTHLRADRLGFLARAEVVYGVLDGDEAGRAGAARFAEHLGERWRQVALPDGADLNDLGRCAGGREEFFRLLAEAQRPGATGGEEASRGR
jgi:DNA primase